MFFGITFNGLLIISIVGYISYKCLRAFFEGYKIFNPKLKPISEFNQYEYKDL